MISDTPVNQYSINAYQVSLEPIQIEHQALLREWRNSPAVRAQMLSQSVISEEQQLAWFKQTRIDPKQLHWVVVYRDELIGSTNVKSLETGVPATQARLLEPGLYIGEPRYQGNIIAFAPTLAMYDYCFEQLNAECFRAVVKSTNSAALRYNQKLGYRQIGTAQQGTLCTLELTFDDYVQSTRQIKQFLSRQRTTNRG
ncbi:GNAT family N-acetyltransferase [Alteromonas gilva]|uniref:GNAT family N-acetyltransferase n=1 Tax=Alteromonas gilva TaxID=2987522 RepID=A0ABT5L0A8_9ALTE|nr:GNAT family N-acetyltransferase [Alteromonas gilva]MDC8830461.1 GNAT family N-acetyltransferase [Alteromonas gilva]